MACIELKLEVKTTLKNKDLATLAFKKFIYIHKLPFMKNLDLELIVSQN